MTDVVLNIVKLFLITQPPLRPIIKGHYEEIVQTKSSEELFIIVFPLQNKFFLDADIPFEDKFKAINCCIEALKPEKAESILKLIEINYSLTNQNGIIPKECVGFISEMLKDISGIRKSVETLLINNSTSWKEFLQTHLQRTLYCQDFLKTQSVVPIEVLLEPIAPPAEIADKQIRLEWQKNQIMELLPFASQEKLINITKQLQVMGYKDTLDYEFEIDKFNTEEVQQFLNILCN
ncbi:hypothetical protein CL6EHI_022140 [Entamoeba histolytica]|uniref:Uncharacterized protein n=3 Tax=Entamoeba histolytica TaxID=5759 RepID=C4MAU0_ENTH1|nr:hypothetical protein EHI_022140 [Entamoeba histolytica HM-1:IMSS]EAL46138.1 hypothetical protein EHI_022140 [Entamoeba histolytica HM-1:IMSS]GAT98963.1 hypothetical protein CL6EHI_022140 [Entamoeba histolytica]|eukprot:XP_651524.1 hypothetical protein EHI_022140 [Entamoeba histolytica HM-1:IMSS]